MARLRRILVIVALLAAACGDRFERDDALLALQTSGTDALTAGCMADTLLLLGELRAAEPETALTAAGRTALVTARERCAVGLDQPGSVDSSVAGLVVERPSSPSPVDEGGLSASMGSYGSASEREPAADPAVQRLVSLGRDETVARCVVEQLRLLTAEYLFDTPTFGLGATPEEASAFALCA